ncbi:predicted protein [Coccidioides posadasii str. Silveira]|uniref:Predicted protein n=2 Tax=Coccidioides posadasii TaxID=199306 RepID=E9DAA7_COCPS|nr:predicted protein [Coccidioides posadasii str. Silveira]KMM64401.1 hypothetical protein CPAG_00753 [Coccidioides posadasii RMSCC 3488]
MVTNESAVCRTQLKVTPMRASAMGKRGRVVLGSLSRPFQASNGKRRMKENICLQESSGWLRTEYGDGDVSYQSSNMEKGYGAQRSQLSSFHSTRTADLKKFG